MHGQTVVPCPGNVSYTKTDALHAHVAYPRMQIAVWQVFNLNMHRQAGYFSTLLSKTTLKA